MAHDEWARPRDETMDQPRKQICGPESEIPPPPDTERTPAALDPELARDRRIASLVADQIGGYMHEALQGIRTILNRLDAIPVLTARVDELEREVAAIKSLCPKCIECARAIEQ
jgi:hypothetical protein